MANTREIKLRIKGINATKKTTKAMKLISAVKLRKARAMHDATLPFFRYIQDTMSDILQRVPEMDSVYLEEREDKADRKKAYIVIASDRGLTGGYNHNVVKLAEKTIAKENSICFPIGNTIRDALLRGGYNVNTDLGTEHYLVDLDTSLVIANHMLDLFRNGEIDELHLIYTEMETAMSLKPKTIQLLPLEKSEFKAENTSVREVLEFEPSPNVVFDVLARKYVKGILYGGMVESFVSEHSARMNAMDSATTNAEKIVDKLTLNYNRARQAAITQEISEIIGGAAGV